MTRHISIDCETLGLGHDAMIVSIGAIEFDLYTGERISGFLRTIDIGNSLGGGTIDASAVLWWLQQSPEAVKSAFLDNHCRVDLRLALVHLSEFLDATNPDLEDGAKPDIRLWARGNMDQLWLESAYKGMGIETPWAFRQWRDQRTFTEYFANFLPERDSAAAKHDAYEDAHYQAKCIGAVVQRLEALGHKI